MYIFICCNLLHDNHLFVSCVVINSAEVPETKAKTVTLRDVDMADREEELNEPVSFSEPDTASTSVTAAMPVKSSKKKKRSGKKNKTKPVESNPGKKEQLFDTEDGWEDVEMSEG